MFIKPRGIKFMNNFSQKLKTAMHDKEISAAELSRRTGISKARISQYTSGKFFPKTDAVIKISDALNISRNYLLGIEQNLDPSGSRHIPILGNIKCGIPSEAIETFEGEVIVDMSINADFCLYARGDSMKDARILDGDLVFIKKRDSVENGKIAAVAVDGETTLKRIYYYPEKYKLILLPENKDFEPLIYEGEMLNSIKILGEAVMFLSNL